MPTFVISPITIGASSPGTVVTVAASLSLAAVQPDLRVQAGSLYATGPQSSFAVVGGGSGSPVAYSTFFGQFSGPVSSSNSKWLLTVVGSAVLHGVIQALDGASGHPCCWRALGLRGLP